MARPPQTAVNAESVQAFGVQATTGDWPHTDILLTDDEAVMNLVQAVVAQQANDFVGISSIDLNVEQKPTVMVHLLAPLLSTGIGDAAVAGVRWIHPSGNEYDETVRVIGVDVTITGLGDADPTFVATLNTARNT